MKTAKEWAESVVIDADRDAGRRLSRLRDPEDEDLGVWLQKQDSWYAESQNAGDARAIIERLVERVQADARAPLEDAVAQRDAYIRGLQREENEWRRVACGRGRVLGDVADALEELRAAAVPGSTAEDVCEWLLPKIEEALR